MTRDSAVRRIRYPEKYQPDRAWVHVTNEMDMEAPCDRVWAWLVRADLWPTWYSNSIGVHLPDSATRSGLTLGTRFNWKTFGVRLESVVEEFVPGERIAWTARSFGVDAYHAWLLTPTANGCHVLTEETQFGWLAALSHFFMPNRMHKYHQIWLERLQDRAAAGLPPAVV
jgi:uncharacterized protein YndB with AHSA1/START domain